MMKWTSLDIDIFLKEKEYVDTAVLPLYPVSFDGNMKQTAAMTEFISLLAVPLERQFKGRILLLPGFSYLKSAGTDKLTNDLKDWAAELENAGFKHIFYVTSDSDWKLSETQLKGSLIWLPSLPLEHMDENYRNTILEDQVKQMLNLFIQTWQGAK